MRIECEFCQGDGCIEDEYGEWKLEAMKIVPVPTQSPYWALFIRKDWDRRMKDAI